MSESTIYKPWVYNGKSIYKGDSVYNGNGVYKDGAGEFVEIGGKKYPVAIIGVQKWIIYNLDFIFDGLIIGGVSNSTSPKANYYDDDENLYGWNGRKCGLLYNWYALKYLEEHKTELLNGYRVPTLTDYQKLYNFLGGNNDAIKKIKEKNIEWALSWSGNNLSKFSALPGGYCGGSSPKFGSIGVYANYSSLTDVYNSNYDFYFGENNVANFSLGDKMARYSLRLLQDIS